MLFATIVSFAQPMIGELPAPRVVEDGSLVVAFITKGFESEATQRNYHQFKIECAHRGWEIVEVTTALEKTSDAVRALIEKTLMLSYVPIVILTIGWMKSRWPGKKGLVFILLILK